MWGEKLRREKLFVNCMCRRDAKVQALSACLELQGLE